MDEAKKQALQNAQESVKRMQEFAAKAIARVDELGKAINFQDAVPIADQLIGLYQRLSLEAFAELSTDHLTVIRKCADRDYAHLNAILQFQAGTPKNQRDALVANLQQAYDPSFNELVLFICHGVSRTADFKALEREARAANQQMQDDFNKTLQDLKSTGDEAKSALAEARKAAAEQGVSKQAAFFTQEAKKHEGWADAWRKRFWGAAAAFVAVAVASVWLFPGEAQNDYAAVHLVTSKVLLLAAFGYVLFFCAKNYMAHRHNAVVNRHRQNALMTYRALVEANNHPNNADIVLNQAARFIFAPQDSGYMRGGNSGDGDISVMRHVARGVAQGGDE